MPFYAQFNMLKLMKGCDMKSKDATYGPIVQNMTIRRRMS